MHFTLEPLHCADVPLLIMVTTCWAVGKLLHLDAHILTIACVIGWVVEPLLR